MRGGPLFIAFFILFSVASLAVPAPMFPGNMVTVWFKLPSTTYQTVISAVTNGVIYGMIVWLVFVLATRNIDKSGVADVKSSKNNRKNNHRK
jgi:mannitol-specific phosphotransferase system IIBC component